ncbi:hypothetical protein MTR67_026406 [Solanum verrucosum]|uniref:Uncharacterized protein n=1 Tax=Solanum verrucosum TaxID=315347 RepID=A0AAF0TUF4_SOLVR|nr:hypothetical protein MTR67_026406 [Solanum verrucosum]
MRVCFGTSNGFRVPATSRVLARVVTIFVSEHRV